MSKPKSKIIQPETPADEIAYEVLATSIVDLSEAMKRLDNSRLSRKLIVILLQDMTKLNRTEIEYVLNALPELAATYLKRAPKK